MSQAAWAARTLSAVRALSPPPKEGEHAAGAGGAGAAAAVAAHSPRQSQPHFFCRKGTSVSEAYSSRTAPSAPRAEEKRRTPLYFSYIGPVYSRPATSSSLVSGACPAASSLGFISCAIFAS